MLRNLFRLSDPPLEEHILEAQDEGEIQSEEASLLLNVLELEDTLVEDVMIPRTDIDCAEESSSVREIAALIVENGHSRIPIYRETRDNILGIVHAKDLLAPLLSDANGSFDLHSILRAPLFVSEDTSVQNLLKMFKSGLGHLAIVQDEYGGTSGLVTMEDVLEVIVGEIRDEHDTQEPEEIQRKTDGSLVVTGRTLLEDLQEHTGIALVSEQVETLGGYLSELSGRIPHVGEQFLIHGRRYTVLEADARQVRSVSISPVLEDREA